MFYVYIHISIYTYICTYIYIYIYTDVLYVGSIQCCFVCPLWSRRTHLRPIGNLSAPSATYLQPLLLNGVCPWWGPSVPVCIYTYMYVIVMYVCMYGHHSVDFQYPISNMDGYLWRIPSPAPPPALPGSCAGDVAPWALLPCKELKIRCGQLQIAAIGADEIRLSDVQGLMHIEHQQIFLSLSLSLYL